MIASKKKELCSKKNYNFDYRMSQVRENKKIEATEKSGLVPWYAGATC